ncbi:MAG TPA: hypothetical protein VLS89_20960 [Candidatus Nanopelagicales bacterium]|nr:hypothetical protein [Candidatus Nanopelagicales bacterium]
MMARRPAHLAVLAAAAGLLGPAFGSCTVFNGLTAIEPGEGGGGGGGGAGPPGASYLSLADAVRACRHITGCAGVSTGLPLSIGLPGDKDSFSGCVSWLSGPIPEGRPGFEVQAAMLACIAAAPDCVAARGCLFIEPLALGDPRCDGITGDACGPGEEVLHCTGRYLERCTSPRFGPGSQCRLGLDDKRGCALAACLPSTDGPPRCDGNTLVLCDPGNRLRIAASCTAVGLTCAEDAEGQSAICGVNDAVLYCDTAGQVTCSPDATKVRICTSQVATEIDCAALGAGCVAAGTGARCAWPSDACSPQDPGVDTCDGSLISLCVAGQPVSFDCASVGLTCQPGDGTSIGACR